MIARITGTVREVGDICRGLCLSRGVRLEVNGEAVELLGITIDEMRALALLIGKEVTITIAAKESLPHVES